MKRAIGGVALAVLAALPGCNGCRKSSGEGGATSTGSSDGAGAVATAPAGPVFVVKAAGMEDPFARLNGDLPKRLNAGYKALKAKSWSGARTEFEAVVTAVPDYTSARFQLVRAAALGGDFEVAVREYGELLARDYVAYSGKLDKARDLAPLRTSPQWTAIAERDRVAQAAYAANLARGFFFVARGRDAGTLVFDGTTVIRQEQEAWFFDPVTSRYRRLTDTGGHVHAINVSADRKTLAFVLVDRILAADGEGSLIDPRAGFVDLATMKTVGPFPIEHTAKLVQIVFGVGSEPKWRTDQAEFVVDSTRSALVRSALGTDDHKAGGVTSADFDSVSHSDDQGTDVTLSVDGTTLTVAGSDAPIRPIRSVRPIDASSLAWSPGHKRLAYAGVLDACKVMAASKPGKEDKNELFLWDQEKKVAARVAQAVSAFDSVWLDDEHLVYEGGVGREGRIHVYDLGTRNDVTLKPRFGAGLYGYPTLNCELKRVEDASPDDTVAPPLPGDEVDGD